MWINAWVCGHLHDGSTKWWRKQITPKTYEILKTTRLFWMKHVAGNEVGRETCSLVKKSCRIWAHVCQNDRKYYQRMIPTSFVLGLYDCKINKPGRILFGFLMIQVKFIHQLYHLYHHIHGISMSLRWSFVAGSAVTNSVYWKCRLRKVQWNVNLSKDPQLLVRKSFSKGRFQIFLGG